MHYGGLNSSLKSVGKGSMVGCAGAGAGAGALQRGRYGNAPEAAKEEDGWSRETCICRSLHPSIYTLEQPGKDKTWSKL